MRGQNLVGDDGDLRHFGDVVDADDVGAAEDAGGHGGGGGGEEALVGGDGV